MEKNSLIIFKGREMYDALKRNPLNRAVSSDDYKDNEYFSPLSVRKAEKRVRKYVKKIQTEGWHNVPTRAFRMGDGNYVLLDGNHRRAALDICVSEGILDDYPEWDVTDMSVRVNPNTGRTYTFEEAMDEAEYGNVHPQQAHTATDIIEVHAKMGSEICREICDIALTYGMSTTLVSDLVTGIRGSSTEDNVRRIADIGIDKERLEDTRRIVEMANFMDSNRPEGVRNTFKESHCMYAFENVYRFCKAYGVEEEFRAIMKAASKCRKPNPFKGFFDCKKTNAHVDQILYILEGFFSKKSSRDVMVNAGRIMSAFESGGAMRIISEFRRNLKFKNNVSLTAGKNAA